MFSKFLPDNPDKEPTLKVRCISCCKRERLLNFVDLKVADHICMSGQHSVLNIGGQQWSAYTHHAIVKNVEVMCPSSAIVTLIHFYSTPFNTAIKIQETTNSLDLHLNEIHIIRYRHQTYHADVVLKRAEKLKEHSRVVPYSIYSRNCESFCNCCCIGNENSFQVENIKDISFDILWQPLINVLNSLFNPIANCIIPLEKCSHAPINLRKVCPILSFFLFIYGRNKNIFQVGNFKDILRDILWQKLINVLNSLFFRIAYRIFSLKKLSRALYLRRVWFILSFFLVICGYVNIFKSKQSGKICSHYCWYKFAHACGSCFLSLILGACSWLPFLSLSKIILKLFSPAFHGQQVKLSTINSICIGDVISIGPRFKSLHGVVSDVQLSPNGNDTNGQIKVIYYKFPTCCGRGTIVEESIELHSEKQIIYKHDYSGCRVFQPNIVVQRAKERLGETKYGLRNLSGHFCYWAKVNVEQNDKDIDLLDCAQSGLQYEKELDPNNTNTQFQTIDIDHTKSLKPSSISYGKIKACILSDVKKGHIVEYRHCLCVYRAAVCTKVEVDDSCPSKRYTWITVVHCGDFCNSIVRKERLKFDLNVDLVYVYKFHPIYRYKTSEIIQRAEAMVGKKRGWTSSLKFARKIVVKEIDQMVSRIDQLQKGDVIKYSSYCLFMHEALVTEVDKEASKLKIVHYTSDSILDTLTVKEESIDVDLEKFPIYKKSYKGYVTYPADIAVERARSRLDERRYSINGNRSSDFVHWAKVVHNPAIVTKRSPSLSSSESSNEESRVLLLPKAGQQYKEFQRFPAYVWSDLYPGVIVEYRYNCIRYRGILSNTDEKNKTIKVINYCTDRFLVTRTIKEYSINRDLQTQDIWIYKSHPLDCYEAGDVLKNARIRLGEQKWNFGRKSWNFCKECVLRKKSNDV